MPPLPRLDYAAELAARTSLKGFQESTKKFIFWINTNIKHGDGKFPSVPQNLTLTFQQFKIKKKTTGLHVTHNSHLRYEWAIQSHYYVLT